MIYRFGRLAEFKIILFAFCILSSYIGESRKVPDFDTISPIQAQSRLQKKSLIVPVAFITYGVLSLISDAPRTLDFRIRDSQPGYQVTKVDDYLIYLPLLADGLLNLQNHTSKNRMGDKAFLYLLSTGINALIVYPAKKFTSRTRPDFSDMHSFPSGHTSNAFVGAEFLWQEYKNSSTLLASSGYVIAATIGFLRIRNNKHWLSDVITGAGTGILSTKLAYHLYPKISKKIFGNQHKITILPFSAFDGKGLSVVTIL